MAEDLASRKLIIRYIASLTVLVVVLVGVVGYVVIKSNGVPKAPVEVATVNHMESCLRNYTSSAMTDEQLGMQYKACWDTSKGVAAQSSKKES